MFLHNVFIAGDANGPKDILLNKERIDSVSTSSVTDKNISIFNFENAIAFPGLINSHDHLDFNLFSQINNGVYNNYTEWGKDIQTYNKPEIDAVLSIPKKLRIQWGMYKNLLNGFTTVINHGEVLNIPDPFINVFQGCRSLHSVAFEKNLKWKLNKPSFTKKPVAIHVGEGTDQASMREIDILTSWNLLKRELIGIHGVAMNPRQAAAFKALVWCPASNKFLLNSTARIDKLKEVTQILFGSDSTLTAGWNLWEHIRLARGTGMVTDEELLGMLTTNPATVWHFDDIGRIAPGYKADIVVASINPEKKRTDAFYALNPEDILLVIHNGKVRLFDDILSPQLATLGFKLTDFCKIKINEAIKNVQGPLLQLIKDIHPHLPGTNFPITQAD